MVLGRWLEDATGRLGWSPKQFWEASLAEYLALVRGWNRAQSGGVEPMTRERTDELVKEYGARTPSIRKPKA